ncbi:hypothetical protein HK405_013134, partial [Cladochytrium tenue]
RSEYTQLVCHASLWSSDGSEERGLVARSSPAAAAGTRGGGGANQPAQAGDLDDVPMFVAPSSAATEAATAAATAAAAAVAAATSAASAVSADSAPGRQPAAVAGSAGRPYGFAPPPRKSSDPTSTGATTFFSSSSAFHAVVARQRPPPPQLAATAMAGSGPHALADGLPHLPTRGAAAATAAPISSLFAASSLSSATFTAPASSSSSSSSSSASTLPDGSTAPSPPRLFHTLVGSTAVPALLLDDPDGSGEGVFFVFSDLSVRIKGIYRLKFHVVDVGTTDRASAAVTAWSDPFEVFPPKVFPGMMPSTSLSRAFANQGLSIHVRMSRPDAVGAISATPSGGAPAPAPAGRAGSARPAGSSARQSEGSPVPLTGGTLPATAAPAAPVADGAKDVVSAGSAAASNSTSSSSSATRRPLSAVNEPGTPRGGVQRRPSDLAGGGPR